MKNVVEYYLSPFLIDNPEIITNYDHLIHR